MKLNAKINQIDSYNKSQISIIKKILFIILIGIHIIIFGCFLFISHQNLLLTIFESAFLFCLVSGTLYTFLVKKPYYFYFYLGIVVASIVVAFILPISLIILIPELILLYILTLRGPSRGEIYAKMRSSKKVNLPYHDPAQTHLYGTRPGYSAFKMDEVWNPDSTKHMVDEEKELSLKKKYSMWKIAIISFICTIGFLITSIQSLILYFS